MKSIYVKSELAVKELEGRSRTLSLRQRQLLITVDGMRTSDELARLFVNMNATQMLNDLEKLGYLTDKNKPARIEQHVQNSHSDTHVILSDEHLAFIKKFLMDTLESHVGAILSRDLINKIKNVSVNTELKPCISRWHMAIRDSKCGRTVADALIDKLHHIMANPSSIIT